MNLERKKKNSEHKDVSFIKYICIIFAYFFGLFKKDSSYYLESSKSVLTKNKRKTLRKPLVFPYKNPDFKIKNELTNYGLKNLSHSELRKEKKKYLGSLSQKKQEDYAYNLRKYHLWLFFWPFYFVWIKFIRLFNLDFVINKDSRYEFSNDQLETLHLKQNRNKRFLTSLGFVNWFISYYQYLKEKIKSKKYQMNNWIIFVSFMVFYVIVFSILIAYSSYVISGKITTPPFSQDGTYPNFFFDKLGLAYAVVYLSVISLILVFLPFLILISLWLSNINDATYNVIFVYSQQMLYLLVGIFLVSCVSMELTLFYAN